MSKYNINIGLEIHIELLTNSKIFSSSQVMYGASPNTCVNQVDLAYPGVLPILNKKVIDLALKSALAFNCSINKRITFDRKNYFYPDNPKNYQITQVKNPLGYNGYLDIELGTTIKRIPIRTIHLEEDSAKSTHFEEYTLLDFNRCGKPLIEIVTEPVLNNSLEAKIFLEQIRLILMYLNISDVKMEEGSIRCDANISINKINKPGLGVKTEVKNVSGFNNLVKALDYEIKRQTSILDSDGIVASQTRRYDEKANKTLLLRNKEPRNDYRYFIEPDIPPVDITDNWINEIKKELNQLPQYRLNKYVYEYNLNKATALSLINNKELCDLYEECLLYDTDKQETFNFIIKDISSYLHKHQIKINETKLNPLNLKLLIDLIVNKTITRSVARELISSIMNENIDPTTIINQTITNDEGLINIINDVIKNNQDVVEDYLNGKERAIKYLIGEVMKATKGMAHGDKVSELLISEIYKIK